MLLALANRLADLGEIAGVHLVVHGRRCPTRNSVSRKRTFSEASRSAFCRFSSVDGLETSQRSAGAPSVSFSARSCCIESFVSTKLRVTRSGESPGRPGARPRGAIAGAFSLNVDAIETRPTRPDGVSR